VDNIVKTVTALIIGDGTPSVEISAQEADFLNSLPTSHVASILKDIFHSTTDLVVESRSFDALLKLRDFDRVGFLIDLYDMSSIDWRCACCRHLVEFPDKRAVSKLASIVQNDPDPDVRYSAAEALAESGDLAVIDALKYAKENDQGMDYEGFPIKNIAERAIQKIRDREGMVK